MVTYFNKKDLVEFGKYLLSEERMLNVVMHLASIEDPDGVVDRLREVSHADFENFLNKKREKQK